MNYLHRENLAMFLITRGTFGYSSFLDSHSFIHFFFLYWHFVDCQNYLPDPGTKTHDTWTSYDAKIAALKRKSLQQVYSNAGSC